MSINTLTAAAIRTLRQVSFDTRDADKDVVHVYGITVTVKDGSNSTFTDGPVNAVIIAIPAINGLFSSAYNVMNLPRAERTMTDIMAAAKESTGRYVVATDESRRGKRGSHSAIVEAIKIDPIAGNGEALEKEVAEKAPHLVAFIKDGTFAEFFAKNPGHSALVLPFGASDEPVTLTAMVYYRPSDGHSLHVPGFSGALDDRASRARVNCRTAIGSLTASHGVGIEVAYRNQPKDPKAQQYLPSHVYELEGGEPGDRTFSLESVRTGTARLAKSASGIRAAIAATAPKAASVAVNAIPQKIRAVR